MGMVQLPAIVEKELPALDLLANLFVGIPKGYTLVDQFIHRLHAKQVLVFFILQDAVPDFDMREHQPRHPQTGLDFPDGREKDLFRKLQVPVIPAGQVMGHHFR